MEHGRGLFVRGGVMRRRRLIGMLLLIASIPIAFFAFGITPYKKTVTKSHDFLRDYDLIIKGDWWTIYNMTLTPSRDGYSVNGTLELIQPGSQSIELVVLNKAVYTSLNLTAIQPPAEINDTTPNYFLQKGIRNQSDFTLHLSNQDNDGIYYFMFGVSGLNRLEIKLTITEYWNSIETFWKWNPNTVGTVVVFLLLGAGIFLLLAKPRVRRAHRTTERVQVEPQRILRNNFGNP
jgi:hypothetical protein